MKSFDALEMSLVLEQLAEHCQFSAGRELAINLRPTNNIDIAQHLQSETTEARIFLNNHQNVGVENAFDVRKEIARARLSATLQPIELVRIRSTLSSSRELKKSILRATNKSKILSKQAKTIV